MMLQQHLLYGGPRQGFFVCDLRMLPQQVTAAQPELRRLHDRDHNAVFTERRQHHEDQY
jgi:hypothetical protein